MMVCLFIMIYCRSYPSVSSLSFFHHWPGLVRPSPPQLAAASVRPALPWPAAAPPPAGSRHSDSPSSGRSVCGLSNTKRPRGSDSERIWGSGSSCVVSADGAPEAGTLSPHRPRGSRAAQRIRQDLSRQQLPRILIRQVLLWCPAAGLLPAERTSMTKSAGIPLFLWCAMLLLTLSRLLRARLKRILTQNTNNQMWLLWWLIHVELLKNVIRCMLKKSPY